MPGVEALSTTPATSAEAAEPIAVTGMSCRLPGGVASAQDFWELLINGQDGITEVPEGRWQTYENAAPSQLRSVTRRGGFLNNAAAFDAAFFGITPREAEQMDPQQRILLEVAWEALETAGIQPHTLAGSPAGVFIGIGSDDYGRQMLEDLPRIEAWSGIGASMCAAANRISYHLDLRGASLAVDTACSSSLVAVHLACQALRAGESSVALAGGVNVMAGPGLTMVLDAAGATSPDGTSKSFDASANGYGRGEGAGVIVLRRLADALRDNDPVLAVIRGSAVSQDGRTNGIMAPSGEAQAQVAEQALRIAGIDARTVDYVEAHGTGTRAGDPIEANALSSVYGRDRSPGDPCLIGSVKPNIGHLEAGAGIAGLIKTVLSLQHAQIPPTIRHHRPTPAVDWPASGLEVVAGGRSWPQRGERRRAAVSSFGYGGTVAHVVLEQAPRLKSSGEVAAPTRPRIFPVSGPGEESVRTYAARLAQDLARQPESNLADVAHTLAARRAQEGVRAAVVADTTQTLQARLRALAAESETDQAPVRAAAAHDAVWVFSGHGSQWPGMGRDLLATEPAFAAVMDQITPVYTAEAGWSPRELIASGEFGGADRIQPMIFAVQVGLVAVLRGWGMTPAAVIGHSVGEIAAAVAAGVLSLEDGARLVCRRSNLLRRVAGAGAMAMVSLPFEDVSQQLRPRADVEAAINASGSSTVVAGTPEAVQEVSAIWEAQGVRVRRVRSDVAFHSAQMDALCPDLAASVQDLRPNHWKVPVYSTAADDPRSEVARDGTYWAANLRNPVRFAAAVRAALEDGHRSFLELAPHPVVTHSLEEVAGEKDTACFASGTLRRARGEQTALLEAAADAYCHGVNLDWNTVHGGPGRLTPVPTTVWQHRDYWRSPTEAGVQRQHDPASNTLLGADTRLADGSGARVWQTRLDFATRPYPGEHPILGTEVLPAAIHLETFFAAMETTVLQDIELRVPVTLTDVRDIQVLRQPRDRVRLFSRRRDVQDEFPTHHSSARDGGHLEGPGPEEKIDIGPVLARCTTQHPGTLAAERLSQMGVAGIGFDWQVEDLRTGPEELLARVLTRAPEESTTGGNRAALIDAVLSVAPILFAGPAVLRMPSRIGEVRQYRPLPRTVLMLVRPSLSGEGPSTLDVRVTDDRGQLVMDVLDLRFSQIDNPAQAEEPLLHETQWQTLDLPDPASIPALGPVVLVGGGEDLRSMLRAALEESGATCAMVQDAAALDTLGPDLVHATVLVLPTPADESPDPAARFDAAAGNGWQVVSALHHLIGGRSRGRLWALTVRGDEHVAPEQSPIWGMSAVLSTEHPDTWAGVIDLDPHDLVGSTRRLPQVLGSPAGESVIRLNGQEARALRLRPVPPSPGSQPLACSPNGTYLITGGLGTLGLEVAHWLAGRGATRIVLAGRSGLPPRSQWSGVVDPQERRRIESVLALEARGVSVRTVSVDIADLEAVRAALDPDALGMPPITGVVHAAGVLDNRMAGDLDQASLLRVMRPKIQGALVLDELFPAGSLEFCVYFSSVGLLLGLTGQTSYAASNSFLDALAHRRRQTGQDRSDRSLSLGWTSWRGMGMAASDAVDQELAGLGAGDISAQEAFQSWDAAARGNHAHVAVVRIRQAVPNGPAVLRGAAVATPAAETGEPDGLLTLEGPALVSTVTTLVAHETARETGEGPEDLERNRPFTELGLDSVMTMAIRRRLQKKLGLRLPATVMWDHPTIDAVGAHLAERVTTSREAAV